jgi:hypothetical protein
MFIEPICSKAWNGSWNESPTCWLSRGHTKGHVEQLPRGSFRVSVHGGIDPLTRQPIRLRSTVKDELQAQIELGRLLKEASEGRTPETDATVATLMDEYAAIAEWDVSTRQTNEGFIRRTIKPALGHLKVRKVRGPILDQLYTRLKRCGDLSCTGRPFTEHRNVPDLKVNRRDPRPAWQQVGETLAEAIQLAADPRRHAWLVGTTADVGTMVGQIRLSVQRADRVRAVLVALGASFGQVSVKGVGSNFPQFKRDRSPSGTLLAALATLNRSVRITLRGPSRS